MDVENLARLPLPEQTTGAVLCGGLGTRMTADGSGLQKAFLPLHGRRLLDHVLESLEGQVDELVINANGDPAAFAAEGLRVLPDLLAGHPGPMAGIHAVLQGCPRRWVLIVPCDTPFLPRDLAARLHTGLSDARRQAASQSSAVPRIAVARTEGQRQSTILLAHSDLADSARDFVARGDRKLGLWLDQERAVDVDFPDAQAFANLNTSSDLAAWQRDSEARRP
jgi:molybdenum cofactor guanylyltransferase